MDPVVSSGVEEEQFLKSDVCANLRFAEYCASVRFHPLYAGK